MTHTLQTPSAHVATFLHCLATEQDLLAGALDKAREVHAALRRGDLRAVTALGAEQELLAAELRGASAVRAEAGADLAAALDIPADGLTLLPLAERLDEPEATAVRAARDRLAALASDLTAVQTRNANLLGHLRSFFRDVLADVTADASPLRYGPTGAWLTPAPGSTLTARGTTTP